MSIDFLLNAIITLFVTVDPLGLAPIFLALTVGMTASQRMRTALRAILISAIILCAFALIGEQLLNALGITIDAFRVAGGLMLLWIGFEMVFEKRAARKSESAGKAVSDDHVHDIAAFPLAVPLMSGPGTITAVILLSGQANQTGNPWVITALIGTIIVILATCFLVFLAANMLDRFIGPSLRSVLSRLLGVLLAALAVQFMIDGMRAEFAT
ncbi:MAG: MarC family protein [Fimbriimonadaceae bacterium]|nr:MarC family protein [Alphaproteobacteria bacterium]